MTSSSSSMFPIPRTLLELTTDSKLINHTIANTIGRNAEKIEGLPPPLVTLMVSYLEVKKEELNGVFGEKEWLEHFGTVPTAPPLPPGIEEIWQGQCPIYPDKKISETHMFVYLPAIVNGRPLTLNSFGILAKNYFPKNDNGYEYICDSIVEQQGNQMIGNSCWVLMTNKGLPASKSKKFSDQLAVVADLAEKTLAAYEIPRTLDAAVCILAQFANSKICLFNSTYMRCQEKIYMYQISLGGFTSNGLSIGTCGNVVNENSIVAALRKFF